MVLVAMAICALAPGAALAGSPRARAASTPADRAAVHAYLLDVYSYVQAVAEAAPAIAGAYQGAASRIAGECPGVLAGAPQEEGSAIVVGAVGSAVPRRTARQRGEEKRRGTQLSDLEEELTSELDSAEQEARRPATIALLAKLKALPQGQGGPVFSQVLRTQTVALEKSLNAQGAGTDVCADMRAWAGSDYRTLSQSSRTIALKRETELAMFLRGLATQSASESRTFAQTPADRALVRKTSRLELQTAKTTAASIEGARTRVEVALGLTANAKREERLKSTSHESTSSTKLSAGRTAAGTGYTVWVQRRKGGPAGTCKSSVEVRKAVEAESGILKLLVSISGGPEVCLSPRRDRSQEPSVDCSKGLLTIETEAPAATRTVDLRMSNGTEVVSRPVLVPRRLGGPAAFYYQAVRGPSPIPVSLIERDARGHTLRALKLRRIVGCSKHPLKYLPGGKLTLVSGSTPQGPRFSIVGERYRLFGRVHTQLKLRTGEGLVSSDEGGEGEVEEGGSFTEGPSRSFAIQHPKPLDSEISAACYPHEYSIFYGLLKQARDTVLAKVAGELVPMLRVHIPSSLHTSGALVYLASVGQPEEILVRSPSGKTVMNEDRSHAAEEARETCEGESEGPGPPPGGFAGTGETSRIVLDG